MEFKKLVKIRMAANIGSKIAPKEEFIIPKPESGEAEDKYIKRCMDAIGGEYDTTEQAVAVCYAQLEK